MQHPFYLLRTRRKGQNIREKDRIYEKGTKYRRKVRYLQNTGEKDRIWEKRTEYKRKAQNIGGKDRI